MNFLVLPLLWMLYQGTKSELVLPVVCLSETNPVYEFVIFSQLPGENSDIYWVQLGDPQGVMPPSWVGEAKGAVHERAIVLELGVGNPQGTFRALADDASKFFNAELELEGYGKMALRCPLKLKKPRSGSSDAKRLEDSRRGNSKPDKNKLDYPPQIDIPVLPGSNKPQGALQSPPDAGEKKAEPEGAAPL